MDADKSCCWSWVEIFFEKLTTFCVQAPPLLRPAVSQISAHTFRKRIKRKLDNPTFSMSALYMDDCIAINTLPLLTLVITSGSLTLADKPISLLAHLHHCWHRVNPSRPQETVGKLTLLSAAIRLTFFCGFNVNWMLRLSDYLLNERDFSVAESRFQ